MKKGSLFITVVCGLMLALPGLLPGAGSAPDAPNDVFFPWCAGPSVKCAQAFDRWISRHFGFRQLAIESGAWLKVNLFHSSSNPSVVLGSDGWLFKQLPAQDYFRNS